MAIILRYSTEFGSFGAHYVKVVKGKPIMSATADQRIQFLAINELWRYSRFLRTNSLERITCQKQ